LPKPFSHAAKVARAAGGAQVEQALTASGYSADRTTITMAMRAAQKRAESVAIIRTDRPNVL